MPIMTYRRASVMPEQKGDVAALVRDVLAPFMLSKLGGEAFMRLWPGQSYPLGATWDGRGTNFALYTENATKVELCLFDGPEATKE